MMLKRLFSVTGAKCRIEAVRGAITASIQNKIALFIQVSLLLVGSIVSATAQAQAPCNSAMYLSQSGSQTANGALFSVTTTSNPFSYAQVGATNAFAYNAGDFNPADGFIYAIRNDIPTNPRLVRVNPATGAVTTIGTVSGLPGLATTPYVSGAFNPADGLLYVMQTSNITPNKIYAIDVTTNTVVKTITLSQGIQVADFAFVNGVLYGVDAPNLLSITISGATGTVASVGATGVVAANPAFGGMVGAPNGLFGYNNSGNFYQFDLTTGTATLISTAPVSSNNEAYHCPTANLAFGADLAVTKTDGKVTYTPGTTNTYTIVVSNNGPFGAQNQILTDTLPVGIGSATQLSCTGSNGGVCGATGTVSGGVFTMTGIDLPYSSTTGGGSITLQLQLTVPVTYTGNLTNTATVTPSNTVIDSNLGNNTATDTDTPVPRVNVAKQSLGGVGPFNFTLTGLTNPTDTVTTATAGTTVTSAQTNFGTVGTAAMITETAVAGYTTTSSCSDSTGGQAAVSNGTTTITIPGASMVTNSTWTCTFVNTKQPILILQKSLPLGRMQAADQFTLSIAGTGAPAPVTTTGSGTTATGSVTVNPATIGSAYTLSETAAGGASLTNYITAYSCTNTLAGGQTPSGNGTSFSVTPVVGDNLTCTLANTRNPKVDLSITKSNGTTSVVSGTTTTYTIVVSNGGPDAADGSVLKDPPAAGLSCATVTCSATGGAVCPPSPSVTNLQSGGLIIPTFPASSSLTFTLSCSVQ